MALSTANSEPPVTAKVNPPAARATPRPARQSTWPIRLARAGVFLFLLFAADRLVGMFLLRGLDRYFGIDRDAAVLCVGHSRTVLGINDALLERELHVPVAKFAINGANTQDRFAVVQSYIRHHPSVKALVYDVSAFTFTDKGLSSNSYKLFYPYLDDPDIAADINRNAASSSEVLWHRLFFTLRFDEVTMSLAFRGYSGVRGNLKIGNVDVAATQDRINHGETRSMAIEPDNVELFKQTLQFAVLRGVRVVLVYIPTLDMLSNSDRPDHDKVITLIKEIADDNPGVTFLDYNTDLESRHELFFDPIHMNAAGQAVVSQRLARDLAPILALGPIESANVKSATKQ
jgi:hypothetical protein